MNRDIRKSYRDQLQDPRWKQFTAEVIERKGAECWQCGGHEQLQVHHLSYIDDVQPWNYSDCDLRVLCRQCHSDLHDAADRIWVELLRFEYFQLEVVLKRIKSAHDHRQYCDVEEDKLKMVHSLTFSDLIPPDRP